MGLDIIAYRRLKPAEGFTFVDGDVYGPDGSYAGDEAVCFYIDEGSRAPELSPTVVYAWAECHRFSAGSYGGYNVWRNLLAILAGWTNAEKAWQEAERVVDAFYADATLDERRWAQKQPNARHMADARPDSPFWELINFADNEGVIGTAASAKLARDFAEWQERAEKYAEKLPIDDEAWFLGKYADWRKAFELAADGGAVSFR